MASGDHCPCILGTWKDLEGPGPHCGWRLLPRERQVSLPFCTASSFGILITGSLGDRRQIRKINRIAAVLHVQGLPDESNESSTDPGGFFSWADANGDSGEVATQTRPPVSKPLGLQSAGHPRLTQDGRQGSPGARQQGRVVITFLFLSLQEVGEWPAVPSQGGGTAGRDGAGPRARWPNRCEASGWQTLGSPFPSPRKPTGQPGSFQMQNCLVHRIYAPVVPGAWVECFQGRRSWGQAEGTAPLAASLPGWPCGAPMPASPARARGPRFCIYPRFLGPDRKTMRQVWCPGACCSDHREA